MPSIEGTTMLSHTTDEFDAFRRDRQRQRAREGGNRAGVYQNDALQQLEQVEANEVREQQLSREVHEFFAEATKQAATIVEKVSIDAEEEADHRLQSEMQGFLMDALSRMNSLVLTSMQDPSNQEVAETRVEPDIKNIVGAGLDGFRYEGSPEARDMHLGQDPFDVDVEDVRSEFREVIAQMTPEEAGYEEPTPIEHHLVAEQSQGGGEAEPAEPVAEEQCAEVEPAPQRAAEPEVDPVEDELERYKAALKALVRQGIMERAEARAAWNARLVARGRA